MASGDTSTCSSKCVTFAANCANVVVASFQAPKVTRARNSLPVSFDVRLTKPVRRAAASIASDAKKSVNMETALRVQVVLGVSLVWCQDAKGNPSYHLGETSPAYDNSIGYRFRRMPSAGALDTGSFSAANIAALEQRGIEPYIAVGRQPHYHHWSAYCAQPPALPPDDASPLVKMAYKLRTEIGQAIYRLRQCTVEPVLGIIKEVLGFRQFSLRGLDAATGEWCLVCLAFNLKRLHVLCAD